MNVDVYLKQGDGLPSLAITCEDASGLVVDLSAGTAVEFYMRRIREEDNLINGEAGVFIDKPAGRIQYDWQDDETAPNGTFAARFRVLFPDDKPMSFPAHGELVLVIERASTTPTV